MALFGFLKKKESKALDRVVLKQYPANIPLEIVEKIDAINWADFYTAYGNAESAIPYYLTNLFSGDAKIAMDATHQLWCSLCHQHAYISTAALPSYDILKVGLLQLDDKLKVELLDIFQGFSTCTSDRYFESVKRVPSKWEHELRQKLLSDLTLFEDLTKHIDEEIASFSSNIVEDLGSCR